MEIASRSETERAPQNASQNFSSLLKRVHNMVLTAVSKVYPCFFRLVAAGMHLNRARARRILILNNARGCYLCEERARDEPTHEPSPDSRLESTNFVEKASRAAKSVVPSQKTVSVEQTQNFHHGKSTWFTGVHRPH